MAAASQPLLLSIAESLEQTQIALLVRESLWGFQVTVGLHILGMILSVGTIVWMDLRLLGVSMRRVPVSVAYRQLMPWAGAGFVVMMVTGSMLLMAYATNAYENPYFRAKVLALALAGANALVYHATIERRIDQWDGLPRPPLPARMAGLFSILLWAGVVLAGRMTAYTLY
jgi:multidrug transporter EmrE-like cation transporter